MTPLIAVALLALVAGAILAVYAFAPGRKGKAAVGTVAEAASAPASSPAGEDSEDLQAFDALGEPARCDAAFAAGAHGDAASTRLLERALDDPVEAVALAAAHALVTSGRGDVLERFVRSNPSPRAQRVASVAALLAPGATASG